MRFRRALAPVAAVFLAAVVLGVAALPALSAEPMYTRQQRFGIAFVSEVPEGSGTVAQSISDYNVSKFGVGWYSDWKYRVTPPQPPDVKLEYVQLIRVGDRVWPPNWTTVQQAVAANPGATWLIGNEPECPNQDAVTPETYAQRYHDAYVNITGWDPTAQIAIGGIVEVTPLRLRWLEHAMAAYQDLYDTPMDVDVWNIHIQILTEGSDSNPLDGAGRPVGIDPVAEGLTPMEYPLTECDNADIFKSMVLDFRQWMKDHGQQSKPLIISETGVLQPSYYLVEPLYEGEPEEARAERGDQAIEQFMIETFDWLLASTDDEIGCPADDDRLVQRWLWFSLNGSFFDEAINPDGFNGSLVDYQTKQMTRFGLRFFSYQNNNKVYIPSLRKQ